MKVILQVGAAALVAVFLPVVLVLSLMLFGADSEPASAGVCSGPAVSADGAKLPKSVGAYSGDQLKNAVAIMAAAKSLGLPLAAQVLGVQTAMGESTLEVKDYGDGPGPDSRGLFQQRDNGAWGSYSDRMSPTISATNFFKALQKVNGWESMDSSLAIHRVQGNADPYHYTRFAQPAAEVVAALGKVKLGSDSCAGTPGNLGKGDDYPWKNSAYNAENPVTHFAYRNCTDFAWYRLMQQLGTPNPPYAMDSLKLAPGNGGQWGAAWKRVGWTVSMTPKVGAVIWYASNTKDVGSYGHVAIVKAINKDGTVLEEGYNYGIPPTGEYYSRTIDPGSPSGYLYLPTKDQLNSVR